MRRLDRILGEARMLRIRRAARAQGLSTRVATPSDFALESEIADRILADLMEGATVTVPAIPDDGPLDGRRGVPVNVFDPKALVPFMAACRDAIDAVVERMDPVQVVRDQIRPEVLAVIYPAGSDRKHSDPSSYESIGRVREAAVADVAVLAFERALYEVVRSIGAVNDLRRPVSQYADPGGVDVLDGKVKRPAKLRLAAGRRNAERLHVRRLAQVKAREVEALDPKDPASEDDDAKVEVGEVEVGEVEVGEVEVRHGGSGGDVGPEDRASDADASVPA